MIQLTKLDNTAVLVNLESIKYVEEAADSIIFFVNGDSMIVKESLSSIRSKVVEFQSSVLISIENRRKESS